jgi:hypothetical protein
MLENDKDQLLHRGDELFRITKDGIDKVTITSINVFPTHCSYSDDHGHSFFNRNIYKNYFFKKEDAEKELENRAKISKKRRMLKDYEIKLNKELGITNHFILK